MTSIRGALCTTALHRCSDNAASVLQESSTEMKSYPFRLVCVGVQGVMATCVCAADYSISGYGTLGFARSDRDYGYQRFVDDHGTFRRDSVAGLQLDVKVSNQFSATAQVKAAPSANSDSTYQPTVAWAFVAYRPGNDLLVRAGRQRIPLYLYSQNYDVGATYDFARLPTEMYSISPNNEMDGVSFSKSWGTTGDEIVLDGYWGNSNADIRIWLRDGFPGVQPPGAMFRKLRVDGGGVALSFRKDDRTYRIGISRAGISERAENSAIPTTYPYVVLAPGVGYFQVDSSLPGPGIPTVAKFGFTTLTLGADIAVGTRYRVVSELARTNVPRTAVSTQSTRGYFSVLRQVDKWTPYVAYAFLKSQAAPLNLHMAVNNTVVPGFVPNAAAINAAQRIAADGILAFDQRSLAVGTSYSLTPTSKIKAELMRVRIGKVSSLVDGPPGSNIRNETINVISLSYSVVF